MLPAVGEVAYPVIEFSQGHLVVVHDEIQMQRCTRAGVRRGWFDDLDVVDASLRSWAVRLLGTRADGIVGWIAGRLVADLALEPTGSITLGEVKRRTRAVLERDVDYWDADGQLDRRLRAVSRAPDMPLLIEALESGRPGGTA